MTECKEECKLDIVKAINDLADEVEAREIIDTWGVDE